jgi:hypothetical protein
VLRRRRSWSGQIDAAIFVRYRYIRTPSAILGPAKSSVRRQGRGTVEGHCNHFADARLLEPWLRTGVRATIGRQHPESRCGGWSLTGGDVEGRLEEDLHDHSGSPRVVIDGRSLSWEEFAQLLAPYVE